MLKQNPSANHAKRRNQLMKNNPGAAFVFQANPVFFRNPDVTYPYRQDSHFYYLTGFPEAESFLVLTPSEKHPQGYRSVLFVQPRDVTKELWEGERYGSDRAAKVFGVDEAHENTRFWEQLPELLKDADRVFFPLGNNAEHDTHFIHALKKHLRTFGRSGKGVLTIQDPNPAVGELRLFKDPEEQDLMRKATQASAEGHVAVMKQLRAGMNESEVEVLIENEFRKNGCERISYGSIVAGGKNACCLHYVANNEALKDGDLILIDAGGEKDYYAADITRCFPVGKKFSKDQAEIYDIVLKANLACIEMLKPGVSYDDLHRRSQEVLAQGLKDLGLVQGSVQEIIEDRNKLFRFYPHRVGHYLGMDVHDVGLYQQNRKARGVAPGMVLTIEPGIYCQPHDQECPERYRGIGVRIEDDVLVTATGCEVLTRGVPKERTEIEALRSGSSR